MKPIISIWIKTRQTFQLIEKRDEKENDFMIHILFFLTSMYAGFSMSFDINKILGLEINYYFVLIISLIVSGLLGLFAYKYILSYIIWGAGKIFQGKASINEIRLALAYSIIPHLVHLLIGVILLIPAIILDNKGLIGYQHPVTIYILWIFALRILVIGLAYFNKYSFGYALLTVIIPAAIMQGLLYGIKFMIQ
ncbi:YIP1 family protein [Maribellus luteus]|uniref:YIP1 family protein n=1 Tax=Maribellus luteus TaxID=2305463 RepID=A0A399SSN3_9BACT|nr:YIP1 family protein [Maribellus luteus]RIJ45919.1 YIP1 family protein [Maribellus luteus]